MFAFAIWDTKIKKLFAARDHVGIKPLCYSEIPGGIAIASEFGALLNLLPEKPAPNPEAVAYVMTLGYIPAPLSIWSGTQKLEPGHKLHWEKDGGITIGKYWSPPTEIDYHGDYSQEKWADLFNEVLNDHLLSDVPLGLFLSGGIDSSALAIGLSDLFPGSLFNEAPIASLVAGDFNIDHEILPLRGSDINHLLDEVGSAFDEPIGYSALLTMQAICSMAAQEFKAVLAGDGGDECFGGYVWHSANIYGGLPATQPIMSSLRKLIGTTRYSLIARQLKRLYISTSFTPIQKYSWKVCARFLPEEAEHLMAPTGLRFSDTKWVHPLAKHYCPSLPSIRALQRIDLMSFCSELILPKVDRASMWHSLEVRVPFLDRRIIEWGLRKPVEQSELQQENSKPTLRRYLQNKVPQKVLNHPKQGFSLRIKDKYNWGNINDQIENSWWVKNGFWDKNWRKIINPEFASEQNRLWFLLMLTNWAQKWL
jgi:asparagine synthase (glutamine-hydrolysing)